MAEKATLLILAEYIIKKQAALEHIIAYHKSFLKYRNVSKSGSANLLGISRGTLYKILRGDESVSIYSLKTFLYALETSNCPVPNFQFKYVNCNNCHEHRFVQIILEAVKSELKIMIF